MKLAAVATILELEHPLKILLIANRQLYWLEIPGDTQKGSRKCPNALHAMPMLVVFKVCAE